MILAHQKGRHLLIYMKQLKEIGGGSRKIGVWVIHVGITGMA
jgi:hypothetical protein